MRHRVILQQIVRTSDGGGGASESWSTVAELWAAVRPIGGDERVAADALAGQLTHEVWVRIAPASLRPCASSSAAAPSTFAASSMPKAAAIASDVCARSETCESDRQHRGPRCDDPRRFSAPGPDRGTALAPRNLASRTQHA
jgi:hypothetical protein